MEKSIHIVGGGISGLIAALEAEQRGWEVELFESNTHLGGRLETREVDGLPLDVGFQVLLSAYPEAQRYLDLEKLDLRYFMSGAVIFSGGKLHRFGDPRDSPYFLTSAFSSHIATLSDQLRLFNLTRRLKRKSLVEIFSSEHTSTKEYLRGLGFSKKIIKRFFRPFFSGIFLEPDLKTSSRMFEFVLKMFSEGKAGIPQNGIQSIAEQISSKLNSKVHRGVEIEEVRSGFLKMKDKEVQVGDVILAGSAHGLISPCREELEWRNSATLYFRTDRRNLDRPILGLMAEKGTLINNWYFVDTLLDTPLKNIMSVTVVDTKGKDEEHLVSGVQREVEELLGLKVEEVLRVDMIPRSLPEIAAPTDHLDPDQARSDQEGIYITGDHLLNASLNAAMKAGREVIELIAREA
jgi:protoporphyrinogen oxidase